MKIHFFKLQPREYNYTIVNYLSENEVGLWIYLFIYESLSKIASSVLKVNCYQ